MIRDPFYRDIIEALNRQVDPELFEQCACDLLRQVYPTLVPLQGGSDSGRDGTAITVRGESLFLVCTTQKDVISNFTNSLKSYTRADLEAKQVVSATSRALSPKQKDNLVKRAQELGFALLQIHDQPDIANRLYGNSKWCVELLSLCGNPPALSCLPLANRPFLDIELLGRETDLDWLNRTNGDALIVGQPGSGKTYLLWNYARQHQGLFVRQYDINEVVKAIREQSPEIIIVDDAHIHLDFIAQLRMLRLESGLHFRLVVNCWPFTKDKVLSAMHVPDTEDTVRDLKLIGRDGMVQIVKACGIYGPDQLISEIVSQSGGKPGLATTLCFLCKQGGLSDVVLGNILKREIKNAFAPMLGDDIVVALGVISLAGNGGVDIDNVSKIIEMPKGKLQHWMTTLATGGVLQVLRDNKLIVIPEILRCFLVKEVFCGAVPCFDLHVCMSYPAFRKDSLKVVIGAMHRGANISHELVRQKLAESGSADDWELYAWLGRKEVQWIIECHPEHLSAIVKPGLQLAPDVTIPHLLEKSVGDCRPLHSTLDQPLRQIEDWIKEAYQDAQEPVVRRKALLHALIAWHSKGGNLESILKCIEILLDPGFRAVKSDPGSGMTYTIVQGHIKEEAIGELESLWPEILHLLMTSVVMQWQSVRQMVHHWLYPYFGNVNISAILEKRMNLFGQRMLVDILQICGAHQGIRYWIKSEALKSNLSLEVNCDYDFELLFPYENRRGDWQQWQRANEKGIAKLVEKWKRNTPDWIINKVFDFKHYYETAGLSHLQSNVLYTFHKFAEIAEDSILWIDAFLRKECDAYYAYPFIKKMIDKKEAKWEECIIKLFEMKEYRSQITMLLLEAGSLPLDVLDMALANADDIGDSLIYSCMNKKLAGNVVSALLTHNNPRVAGYAALGLWHQEPKGRIDGTIREIWANAIVGINDFNVYLLTEVLENESVLAYRWLKCNLKSIVADPTSIISLTGTVQGALDSLNQQQKCELLNLLEDNWRYYDLARHLISCDSHLYGKLLSKNKLQRLHLCPLKQKVVPELIPLIQIALAYGYNKEEIARALVCISREWSGNESRMWERTLADYHLLCDHPDPQVQGIGLICVDYADSKKRQAEEEEYDEEVFGI